MALVSMQPAIRPQAAVAFVERRRRPMVRISVLRVLFATCAAASVFWCVARAADIPMVVDGGHTLVAVEPLLRSLQIGYDIDGVTLDVDGRRYPQPLLVRSGVDYVDAYDIAHFLRLSVTDRSGVLVYSAGEGQAHVQPAPPAEPDLDAVRDQLVAAINDHRASMGGAPLVIDPIAQAAAQAQALDMALAAQIRHQDAQGRSPMQRYSELGGRASWYGENVGWYSLDVFGRSALWNVINTLDAEMMSERPPDDGHRKNILSSRFQAVGVGICLSPSGIYLAEDFVGH